MAKLHYEMAPNRGACGKDDVETTSDTSAVTCTQCRETAAYASHLNYVPEPGHESDEVAR